MNARHFCPCFKDLLTRVADPDLQIKRGGGGKVPPFCFKPFGPQFGLKLGGGGGGCCSLGPSPRSATGRNFIRLCSHYGSMGRIVCYTAVFSVGCVADYMANSFSWIEWTPIGYVTFHFRDRCVAWTEALSSMVSAPAQKLSSRVWT